MRLDYSGTKMAPNRHVGTGMTSLTAVDYTVRAIRFTILLLFVSVLSGVLADDISTPSSESEVVYFDQLYAKGVKAYNDQLWYKCAYNLEKAVDEYRKYRKTLTDCRIACKQGGTTRSKLQKIPADLGEFTIFEKFLQHADCFRRCKSDAYEFRPGLRLTKQTEETFEKRKPYAYLQYCWYKLDRVKQAASAAYTFYLANPEDEDMRRNIAFFRDKAKVAESDFVDLELRPYKEHYIRAMLAYTEEDWSQVAEHMEQCVEQYFIEEERCRVDCEDTLEEGSEASASHFTGAVANHIMNVLDCQLGCEGNLSIIYSEPIENFVAQLFHYLQYAYYKTDKVSEAVEATANFLLFNPDNDIVKENKMIFKKKYKYEDDMFIPSQQVKEYVDRQAKLRKLLDYLKENMMVEYPDVVFVTDEDAQPTPEEQANSKDGVTTDYETWMDRFEKLGLHLIAKESDLKRKHRFAADGLLKAEQCEEMLTLMEDIPADKKGVQLFTLEHARETLLSQDENYEASLRLFLRATEVLRHYAQRYYNITESLYFRHAYIVCWQQVEKPDVESDCVPQEFGTCVPEKSLRESELVDNEFVIITFLNNVEDADFYFLGENITFDSSLGMKHGRTVGFHYGDRHGLNIPATGRRCSLVVRCTTYRDKDEYDYISTIQMVQKLEELRMAANVLDQKEVMASFEKKGVRVAKNGTALKGTERVVVDGLASEAECSTLKNMVLDLGKAGDGYEGRESPHTQNELFAGVSLLQVTQSGALVGDGYDRLDTKPSFISPHTEHELFQGLTVYRAAKLMHMGMINLFSLKTFLDLSEKSRLYLEKYFNLSKPLYFDFTHLVCRSAIDETKKRDDLSHPVHADNCVLQPNGTCLKEYPAFVQRDYSAILYLNDDFEGGEFFFAYPNKTEQVVVNPTCGRLVGFNAAEFHGVKAVKKGIRCALALWFTQNPTFKELAHIHAKKVLRTAEKKQEEEQNKFSREQAAQSESVSDDKEDGGGKNTNVRLDLTESEKTMSIVGPPKDLDSFVLDSTKDKRDVLTQVSAQRTEEEEEAAKEKFFKEIDEGYGDNTRDDDNDEDEEEEEEENEDERDEL